MFTLISSPPQMPDEDQKRYLYIAIARATRWVYLEGSLQKMPVRS